MISSIYCVLGATTTLVFKVLKYRMQEDFVVGNFSESLMIKLMSLIEFAGRSLVTYFTVSIEIPL